MAVFDMSSQLRSDLSKDSSKAGLQERLPEENVCQPSKQLDTTNNQGSNHVGKKTNPTLFFRNDPSPFLNEIRNIDEELRRSAIGHCKLEFPSRKTRAIKIQLDVEAPVLGTSPDSEIVGNCPVKPKPEKTILKKNHVLPPLNIGRDLKEAVELLKTFSCFTPEENVLLGTTCEQSSLDHSDDIAEHESETLEPETFESFPVAEEDRHDALPDEPSVFIANRTFQLPETIVQLKKKFPEEFAQLTDCLENILDPKRQSVIAVCGLEPQTGCSTILLAIAYGLGLKGKKISVIDADFKSPTLKDFLKVNPVWGWTELLQDDFPVDHVSYTLENIHFFPLLRDVYPSWQNLEPSELCRMIRQAFQTNCEDSDLILLDCGSLLSQQEDITLGTFELFRTDGVLFVKRPGRQPKLLDLRAFDRELQKHDFVNFGVVENFFVPRYKKAA